MIRIDPAKIVQEAAAAREEAKTAKINYYHLKSAYDARIRSGEGNTEEQYEAMSAAGDAHRDAYHRASEKAQQAYALLSFIRINTNKGI